MEVLGPGRSHVPCPLLLLCIVTFPGPTCCYRERAKISISTRPSMNGAALTLEPCPAHSSIRGRGHPRGLELPLGDGQYSTTSVTAAQFPQGQALRLVNERRSLATRLQEG